MGIDITVRTQTQQRPCIRWMLTQHGYNWVPMLWLLPTLLVTSEDPEFDAWLATNLACHQWEPRVWCLTSYQPCLSPVRTQSLIHDLLPTLLVTSENPEFDTWLATNLACHQWGPRVWCMTCYQPCLSPVRTQSLMPDLLPILLHQWEPRVWWLTCYQPCLSPVRTQSLMPDLLPTLLVTSENPEFDAWLATNLACHQWEPRVWCLACYQPCLSPVRTQSLMPDLLPTLLVTSENPEFDAWLTTNLACHQWEPRVWCLTSYQPCLSPVRTQSLMPDLLPTLLVTSENPEFDAWLATNLACHQWEPRVWCLTSYQPCLSPVRTQSLIHDLLPTLLVTSENPEFDTWLATNLACHQWGPRVWCMTCYQPCLSPVRTQSLMPDLLPILLHQWEPRVWWLTCYQPCLSPVRTQSLMPDLLPTLLVTSENPEFDAWLATNLACHQWEPRVWCLACYQPCLSPVRTQSLMPDLLPTLLVTSENPEFDAWLTTNLACHQWEPRFDAWLATNLACHQWEPRVWCLTCYQPCLSPVRTQSLMPD